MSCFDSSKLLSEDVEGSIGSGSHHAAIRYCEDEDYDMLIDEYEEEMMLVVLVGVSGCQSRFSDSLLSFKKSISYIPVALENKQHSSSTTTLPLRECTSVAGRGSVMSDSKTNDKTYRFLYQQEAHDLSSIVNILSKNASHFCFIMVTNSL